MKKILGALFVVSVLIVCVSTQGYYLDPSATRYAEVAADSVRVFLSEADLDSLDYVKIAVIEAKGSGEHTSQTGMIKAMRKKAGKLGGNGLLLPKIDEPSRGAKFAGAILGTGTKRKGNAVVIHIIGRKAVAIEE